MYETITTTNSKLFNNEVKIIVLNEPKSLVIDPINVLSWSHVSVNTSSTCILVSRIIYDDEMTASLKGSDCLNAENACSNHGIWTWILTSIWTLILTICLRSEMKILSSCVVIAYPLSVISWISSDVMRILETWSTNCSLIMINVCIYHLFLEI